MSADIRFHVDNRLARRQDKCAAKIFDGESTASAGARETFFGRAIVEPRIDEPCGKCISGAGRVYDLNVWRIGVNCSMTIEQGSTFTAPLESNASAAGCQFPEKHFDRTVANPCERCGFIDVRKQDIDRFRYFQCVRISKCRLVPCDVE